MERYAAIAQAAIDRREGNIGPGLTASTTAGGTWVLSSTGEQNDDGRPHDLLAVLPAPLFNGSRVVELIVTVHPDLVVALKEHLDDPTVAR